MTKLYGKTFNLPPLSAKIYAYLIFDFDMQGLTFDDLVEIFSASKSSVSTSLNLLMSQKLIKDINKVDERKRYFVINSDFVKLRLVDLLDRLQEEINVLTALEDFSKTKKPEIKQKLRIHKIMLEKNIENIEESLSKL